MYRLSSFIFRNYALISIQSVVLSSINYTYLILCDVGSSLKGQGGRRHRAHVYTHPPLPENYLILKKV